MQAVNTIPNSTNASSSARQYSDTPTSSVGNLSSNIAAALCYIGPFGLIFLILEKQSRLVRFHSVQALLYGIMVIALSLALSVVGGGLSFILAYISPTLAAIVWVLMMVVFMGFVVGAPLFSIYKAFTGQMNKLPIIGKFAERAANK